MLEFKRGQRTLLAETLRDAANVAVGAMVFGQFLADRPFSGWLMFTGGVIWISFVALAVSLAGRRQP